MEQAFRNALAAEARGHFADAAALAATLAELRASALAAHPDIAVDADTFAAELARRLGAGASLEVLVAVHAGDVHLAIACAAGDERAIRRFEASVLDEVDHSARRVGARREQADEVRAHLRRILFVSEPGRPAALASFSGRGDLRSYLRVIATRELVRAVGAGHREAVVVDDSLLEKLAPASDPRLGHLRDTYRHDVDAAIRTALAGLGEEPRVLLRYSVIDGWTIDQIAALYGVHRATAARRVAAARDQLGDAIRTELAARLAISVSDVDSIVQLVQSQLDVSLERLLGGAS